MATSTIDQHELEALEQLFGEGQLENLASEAELKIGDSDFSGPEAIVASLPITIIWTILLRC